VPYRIIWSWYTGRWWVGCNGCYIWYSDEGPGRAAAPLSFLLAVPNVTAYLSTASVPITVLLYDGPLLCGFNVAIKGLRKRCRRNTCLDVAAVNSADRQVACLFGDVKRPAATLLQRRQRRYTMSMTAPSPGAREHRGRSAVQLIHVPYALTDVYVVIWRQRRWLLSLSLNYAVVVVEMFRLPRAIYRKVETHAFAPARQVAASLTQLLDRQHDGRTDDDVQIVGSLSLSLWRVRSFVPSCTNTGRQWNESWHISAPTRRV